MYKHFLMPNEVHIVKADELQESTGQTPGMTRQGAIIDKSDKFCSLIMLADPHSSSAVHHHGEQDTIVYARAGHGSIVYDNGARKHRLSPGDFALIPAFTEHQEMNDGDEEVVWVIIRSGREPVTKNIEGWGKS